MRRRSQLAVEAHLTLTVRQRTMNRLIRQWEGRMLGPTKYVSSPRFPFSRLAQALSINLIAARNRQSAAPPVLAAGERERSSGHIC